MGVAFRSRISSPMKKPGPGHQAVTDGGQGGQETPFLKAGTQIGSVQGTSTRVKSEDGQQTDHHCSAMVPRHRDVDHTQGQSDVQDEQERWMSSEATPVKVAVGKLWIFGPATVDGYATQESTTVGQIHDVRKPVAPAGEKTVLFSKSCASPQR